MDLKGSLEGKTYYLRYQALTECVFKLTIKKKLLSDVIDDYPAIVVNSSLMCFELRQGFLPKCCNTYTE